MKGLILFRSNWVKTSRMVVVLSKRHEYCCWRHQKVTALNSKKKCGLSALQVLPPGVNQQTLTLQPFLDGRFVLQNIYIRLTSA